MHIILITPARPSSRAGNRATATRWAQILLSLGHQVDIANQYENKNYDLMIALHAWRSAEAIQHFADQHPEKPLIVALTGTDAYRFLHSHPKTTLHSIALAHYLVGLHAGIADILPEPQRKKLQVIMQSAEPVGPRSPDTSQFRMVVAGHLREEKDPLRPAMAVRNLPSDSRLKVDQYGKAHKPEWAEVAQAEMAMNPRYQWHGEVEHRVIQDAYRRARLLVLPSRMEGGANVISEAVVAGLPVIASKISGSIGLLGPDYPGYYPVEDHQALQKMLLRAENDEVFYQALVEACLDLRGLFTLERERAGWARLLTRILHEST